MKSRTPPPDPFLLYPDLLDLTCTLRSVASTLPPEDASITTFVMKSVIDTWLSIISFPTQLRRLRISLYRLKWALRSVSAKGNSPTLFIFSLLAGTKYYFLERKPLNPHLVCYSVVPYPSRQIVFLSYIPEDDPLMYYI